MLLAGVSLLSVSLALTSPVAAIFLSPSAGAEAEASQPEGPEPEAGGASIGLLSNMGEDRGSFELGLGSVVLGVGVGLLVLGAVELKRARDRKAQCTTNNFGDYDSNCDLDPAGLIFASSALAFTFSVPAFVGGALLVKKGAKIHRDYRAVKRASLTLRFSQPPPKTSPGRTRAARGASFGAQIRF